MLFRSKMPVYDNAQKAALAAKFDKKNDEQSTVSMVVPAVEGRCAEIKMPLDEYVKTIGEIAEEIKEKK